MKFSSYCLSKSSDDKMLYRLDEWTKTLLHGKDTKNNPTNLSSHSWLVEKKEHDPVINQIYKNITEPKKKVLIVYGDGGKGGNNLKGSPCSKNVGLERLIFKNFKCFESCEKGTSQDCPCCRTKNLKKQKFEERIYTQERHQLLHCQNVDCKSRWWSRDVVGSFNILYKAFAKLLEIADSAPKVPCPVGCKAAKRERINAPLPNGTWPRRGRA